MSDGFDNQASSHYDLVKMILQILRFPLWWYKEAPSYFPYLLKNIVLVCEDLFAIKIMARCLFTPLFHDVTIWGRVLSFIYRIGRIMAGVVAVVIVAIAMMVFFALWFVFPPYLIYLEPASILIFVLVAFVWSIINRKKDLKKISESRGEINFEEVSDEKLSGLLQTRQTVYALLVAIVNDAYFQEILTKIGLEKKLLVEEIEKNQAKLQDVYEVDKLRALVLAKASLLSSENLQLSHLFLVILDLSPGFKEIADSVNLDIKLAQEAISWYEQKEKSGRSKNIWDKDYEVHSLAGVNRTLEGTVTPTLNPYVRDLTAEAKSGVLPPTVERRDLTTQVSLILARSGENNVILVGEPGSGKTYLVYDLAQKIINGDAPPPLRFKRVVVLDYTALLGGTKNEGEILERMKKIIEEIEYSGNIILFLDEFQNLAEGESGKSAVYTALEPHLSSSRFQVIAAISFENYHATLEQNEEFANLFQKVEVPEATKEETLEVLKTAALGFEKRQKILISYPALLATIELSKKYLHDRVLPDKAVSILDEAAVMVASRTPGGIVGKEDIAKVISLKSHVPVTKMTEGEQKKLLNLENVLHERMVDQEEAVSAVANALRRARVGLSEEKRPIASFLFVGPTGVGKTELAKTLAEFYFGNEETMVRLDMSEFQNKESIYSLIGPPLGQKGSELGGRLTEAIRRRPFSLLLLDEMEKAHPDILNLFLQVMDEARLTDSTGRTVDFSNAIIIATSNAGTRLIQEEIEKRTQMEAIKTKVGEFLKTVFRPEFLNRFDGIVVFKPLSREDVEKIAELMIKKLTDNLTQKGINFKATPKLLTKLAEVGFDPTLGARPLRRLIQDKVEAKLAKEILKGSLKRGTTILLDETLLSET